MRIQDSINKSRLVVDSGYQIWGNFCSHYPPKVYDIIDWVGLLLWFQALSNGC